MRRSAAADVGAGVAVGAGVGVGMVVGGSVGPSVGNVVGTADAPGVQAATIQTAAAPSAARNRRRGREPVRRFVRGPP